MRFSMGDAATLGSCKTARKALAPLGFGMAGNKKRAYIWPPRRPAPHE